MHSMLVITCSRAVKPSGYQVRGLYVIIMYIFLCFVIQVHVLLLARLNTVHACLDMYSESNPISALRFPSGCSAGLLLLLGSALFSS